MGQAKWITTNHTKDQSSSREDDVVYMVGLPREPSYELLLENQMITSNKYCSQLGQLKAAFNRKKLVNRKSMISHQDNTRPHVLWWPGKICYSLSGKFWFICCTHHTLHLQISIYFDLYKILLIEKNVNSLEYFKRHLGQLFAQKDKMF